MISLPVISDARVGFVMPDKRLLFVTLDRPTVGELVFEYPDGVAERHVRRGDLDGLGSLAMKRRPGESIVVMLANGRPFIITNADAQMARIIVHAPKDLVIVRRELLNPSAA